MPSPAQSPLAPVATTARRSASWRRARFGVLLAALAVAAWVGVRTDVADLQGLQAAVVAAGAWGPLVYGAVFALATAVLLPAAPFAIGAGLLFGSLGGVVTALVAAVVGACGAFLLGRLLGRDTVERFGGRRVRTLDAYIAERGFSALLIVRLLPFFPYNVINAAPGVTGIRLRTFVSATAIGIVPGVTAYAVFGGTAQQPAEPAFFVVIGVIAGDSGNPRARTQT